MECDLRRDEVHVVYCWCERPVVARLRQEYLTLLSPDEHQRYERFYFDKDRRQFLVARTLLRTVLSHYAPIAPAAWQFQQVPGGKPVLVPPRGVPPLRFNVSNTVQLVACAVTIEDEVGVDVEGGDRTINFKIAGHCFADSECSVLDHAPDDERKRELFLRFWTLKEAYIKARGLGLALPLTKFSFSLDAGSHPTISFHEDLGDDPHRWQFFQRPLGTHHYLAVAVQRRASPRCRFVVSEWTPLAEPCPPTLDRALGH
jgi:4'-phosphopantetheinyl transferase